MRLVVEYTTGDGCNESWEHVVPFEYESAEKLLVDLEACVMASLAEDVAFKQRWHAFQNKWGADHPKNDKEVALYLEEHRKLVSPGEFTLFSGASQLPAGHFIEEKKFIAPSIYTVDEWFGVYGM